MSWGFRRIFKIRWLGGFYVSLYINRVKERDLRTERQAQKINRMLDRCLKTKVRQ